MAEISPLRRRMIEDMTVAQTNVFVTSLAALPAIEECDRGLPVSVLRIGCNRLMSLPPDMHSFAAKPLIGLNKAQLGFLVTVASRRRRL